MKCAKRKMHLQARKSVCCELIAHDNIAEAERPRRADFRRTVQKVKSELSESEARPAAACFLVAAQRAQARNAAACREPAPLGAGGGRSCGMHS